MESMGPGILIFITLLAATINGGLGYGFSSITVPVALLFYTNRILNPAIVLMEVMINAVILALHIKTVKALTKRILPVLLGAIPGVLIGAMLLSWVNANWTKLMTYALLLPLIVLQAAGIRKVVQPERERIAGIFCGGGVGFFYALTTISGPPLAMILSNQGFAQKEFRAAMSMIRLFLSSLAAIAYFYFGFFQPESFDLLKTIVPCVITGIPLGVLMIRKLDPGTFRRICISFDVWIIGFGLSYVMAQLEMIHPPYAYILFLLAVLTDGYLLYRQYGSNGYFVPGKLDTQKS